MELMWPSREANNPHSYTAEIETDCMQKFSFFLRKHIKCPKLSQTV